MGWKKDCAAAARELTKEKRQEFLDLMWAGKTLGEAREQCGISSDAAVGILNAAIEKTTHYALKRHAD